MQSYSEHLKSCIDNSREIAEEEFSNQSLELSQIKDMRRWYVYISDWVTRNPPEYYTKYLEVKENYKSEIVGINYVYFDKNERISEASIKIISELYDT